jgi:hypothetical protein
MKKTKRDEREVTVTALLALGGEEQISSAAKKHGLTFLFCSILRTQGHVKGSAAHLFCVQKRKRKNFVEIDKKGKHLLLQNC